MIKTTYKLQTFDPTKAKGSLCVVVNRGSSDIQDGTVISNVDIQNNTVVPNPNFIGTGICKKAPDAKFFVVIQGENYTFDKFGRCLQNINYTAFLGTVQNTNTVAGDVVNSSTTTTITRGMTPEGEEWNTTVSGEGQTTVSNLSARDHFAIHALRGMLNKIDDPSELSDSEINHYCSAAYQWAANMMTVAAESRTTLTVEREEGQTSASNVNYEEVDVPETNTEKFLNNIVYALQRTDAVIGEEPVMVNGVPTGKTQQIVAERLTAPNIEAWLKDYKVLYKYRNIQEATDDNWSWGNGVWTKEGYDAVGGEYTNDAAKDLPTWRKVVKVSVVEMPDLIQAIKDLTIQVKKIADDKEPVDVFDATFDGSFHPNTNSN